MKIKDIVTFVSKSITPQNGVTYNLYSLPSFDEGKTFEVLDGADIQSNKYDVPNKCILFNKLHIPEHTRSAFRGCSQQPEGQE